jgi:hypothetical protein
VEEGGARTKDLMLWSHWVVALVMMEAVVVVEVPRAVDVELP